MKWDGFLKERSIDKKTKKSYYVHKKLRSSYHSIKRNMPWLWTFYDCPDLNIPNTNNGLEGHFTDLKTKLRYHNGLSKNNRKLFIDEYFRNSFEKYRE
ncbi:MAG: transposase [Prevotellaceae bacterium]|nr:transposase [Prevotellaceae bacterium]